MSVDASMLTAAVDAVQEEFDERRLGEADLLVRVILEESGYPSEVERLRDAASFALAALKTDTTHRGLGEACGRDACFLCAAEVRLRDSLAPKEGE